MKKREIVKINKSSSLGRCGAFWFLKRTLDAPGLIDSAILVDFCGLEKSFFFFMWFWVVKKTIKIEPWGAKGFKTSLRVIAEGVTLVTESHGGSSLALRKRRIENKDKEI